jgi:hypothetical protein
MARRIAGVIALAVDYRVLTEPENSEDDVKMLTHVANAIAERGFIKIGLDLATIIRASVIEVV